MDRPDPHGRRWPERRGGDGSRAARDALTREDRGRPPSSWPLSCVLRRARAPDLSRSLGASTGKRKRPYSPDPPTHGLNGTAHRKFWADDDGSELAQSPLLVSDLERKISMPRLLPCNRNRQSTPCKLSPLQKLTMPHKQLTHRQKRKRVRTPSSAQASTARKISRSTSLGKISRSTTATVGASHHEGSPRGHGALSARRRRSMGAWSRPAGAKRHRQPAIR